jgi:hypothetical protein
MTTLAAFQGNGWAVIGADSRATDEGGRVFNLATPKIIDNNGYLIATSGASRGGNLAQFGWNPPKLPSTQNVTTLDKFVTRKLIPSLRKHFVEQGYDGKDDGDAAWQDSAFLIAINGVIYPIFQDYSWDRDVRNVYYGGSGGDTALGAMIALGIEKCVDDSDKAQIIIRKAIEVSTKWDAFSSAPIFVTTQFA